MSRDDLENRVEQFRCLELPGQPMAMHMGTSRLVSDLWNEVERLRAQLEQPAVPEGLLDLLCSVGHHGTDFDELGIFEIGPHEVEKAQDLYTELRDAMLSATPHREGGEE